MMNGEKILLQSLKGIQNIIFDLGNVIVNLNFDATIEGFRKLGLDEEVITMDQAYADPVFYELETGQTSPDIFREKVRGILNNGEVTDEQIDEAWCAMLLDVPAHRVRILQELGEKYNLYLLSNTNEIHINYFHKKFRQAHNIEFSSLFKKDYYSHELKERKPDLTSYRKMVELAGIDPAETMFIDDLEKNIRGAQRAGFSIFWLKDGLDIANLF